MQRPQELGPVQVRTAEEYMDKEKDATSPLDPLSPLTSPGSSLDQLEQQLSAQNRKYLFPVLRQTPQQEALVVKKW